MTVEKPMALGAIACMGLMFLMQGRDAKAEGEAIGAQHPASGPGVESKNSELETVSISQRAAGALKRDVQAGKTILRRELLEASGADTIAAVLRRDPAVSVSANGAIGLNGLPGLTEILIDGQRPWGGIKPLELEPSMVERIEIIKGSMAETGPFGIAGTINIITRSTRKALPTQIALTRKDVGDNKSIRLGGLGGWRDAVTGTQLSLGVSALNALEDRNFKIGWTDTKRKAIWEEAESSREINKSLILTPSASWYSGESDDWSLKTTLAWFQNKHQNPVKWVGTSGSLPQDRPIRSMQEDAGSARDAQARLLWRRSLADKGQWAVSGGLGRFGQHEDESSYSQWPEAAEQNLSSKKRHSENSAEGSVKYTSTSAANHTIVYAVQFKHRVAHILQRQDWNGTLVTNEPLFGESVVYTTRDISAWAQDDWNLDPQRSLNLGLRLDSRSTAFSSDALQAHSQISLPSPSANFMWKLDEDGHKVFSAGISRTFRQPLPHSLNPRPRLSSHAQCSAPSACGGNQPDEPDRAGNPQLRPQKAWGIEAGFQHFWGEESQASVNASVRWIDHAFSHQTRLESVPWAHTPRWVKRPYNVGRAYSKSLNFSFESALPDWFSDSPKVGVQASLFFSQSFVTAVMGPNNRLDEQAPVSGKLGVGYKPSSLPAEIRVEALFHSSNWWQLNENIRQYQDSRREWSIDAIWSFSEGNKLHFSASKINPDLDISVEEFDRYLTRQSSSRLRPQLQLRWEFKL